MQLAKPVNDLRRRYGLSLLVSLEEVLTWGDFALYPDIPELAPTSGTPPTHRYLGAVPSSVTADLPPWWDDLPANRPLVYATLGSSGGAAAWPVLLEALARLPVTVLVAAALRVPVRPQRGNLYMADFLPGTRAAERAAVVVSNGGPATSYQALAAGKPVLGIASTYDQCLTAAAIADAGAGLCLRTAGVTAEQIERAVTELLEVQRYRSEAARLAVRLASYDTVERFRDFVREATDPPEVA
jgi:UDP:flavonoid glycosyltransferase YjiC (YdhE family)